VLLSCIDISSTKVPSPFPNGSRERIFFFFFLSQNYLKEKFTELFFLMQAMELLHAGEEIFFYFEYQVENSREVIEKIYE